jgi:hypothetical protein
MSFAKRKIVPNIFQYKIKHILTYYSKHLLPMSIKIALACTPLPFMNTVLLAEQIKEL